MSGRWVAKAAFPGSVEAYTPGRVIFVIVQDFPPQGPGEIATHEAQGPD